MDDVVLNVKDLRVYFDEFKAVDGISFSIKRGETVALLGKSGSGKSVTCLSLMNLAPKKAKIISGEVWLGEKNLLELSEKELSKIRGKKISLVFQDPQANLSPYHKIEEEMVEAVRIHNKITKKEAREKAAEMLSLVGIKDAAKRMKDYPNQFSGGEKQRIAIALSLLSNPDLLILDEVTTALDKLTERKILTLIEKLKKRFKTSILLVTHDITIARKHADSVLIMYNSRIVEKADKKEIFNSPLHPYTKSLLGKTLHLEKIDSKNSSLCPFFENCQERVKECEELYPPEIDKDGHIVSCWRHS